jgi:hypothetical protein
LLRQIALTTGGTVRSLDGLAGTDLFAAHGDSATAPGNIQEVWYWPLSAFLFVFLVELAIRLGWVELIRGRIRG